ncbi:sugar phosphate isomerase/epimerase family protein [Niveispirillum fermenti]|uniref:sugar phosphate isomerase/epimerase family protein n=1 Tax=Niveispirillum fermenti TaxID=1233113 RepID=UPI004041D205
MAGMLKRLLGAGLGAWMAGAAVPAAWTADAAVPADRIAVQLYSLHAALLRDPATALDRLRAMGVTQVEAYGTLGMSPSDFRAALDKAGLTAVGSHVWLGDLRDNPEKIVETARAVGYRYVGVAWIKPPDASPGQAISRADVDAAIAAYKAACPVLKAAGLGVMYHIHGYEFVPDGDGILLDRLLAGLDPDCVDIELDVFWVVKAGADPVALLDRLGSRVKMLHLKDMVPQAAVGDFTGQAPPGDFAPVGQGRVDWPALLAAARRAGVEWYVLEDELADAARHLEQSLEWLRGHALP